MTVADIDVPPKVSVVVPVFNTEKTIERCGKSVLSQTFKDLELIFVDDGSDDGSLAICTKLGKSDRRVTVLDGPNQGPGSGPEPWFPSSARGARSCR